MGYNNQMKYCYHNGSIKSLDKASINIYDIGFLRGYAVFDYIKAYHGVPFLLPEHLRRLDHSAKRFGMKVPLSQKKIAEIIDVLIKKNKEGMCAIRIVLSGGVGHGLDWDKKNPTFVILTEPLGIISENVYKKGASLITLPLDRFAPDTKHTNYSFAVANQSKRKKAGAIEILYTLDGYIREASTSNVFIVKNNKLITTENSILHGITRNLIFSLARREFDVSQCNITLKELYAADECFITATNKEVLPIVKVDGKVIGKGAVGPVTKRVATLFEESVRKIIKKN